MRYATISDGFFRAIPKSVMEDLQTMRGRRSEKERNKARRRQIFFRLSLFLVIGASVGRLIVYWVELGNGFPISALLVILLSIPLTLFVQINLHELGHLLFGRLLGYQLMYFQIGPFSWQYQAGRMRFSLKASHGYVGACGMLPPPSELPMRHHLGYFAGGLLVNALTLIPITWLLLITDQSQVFIAGSVAALVTLALILMNGIPQFSALQPNDGQIIVSVLRESPLAADILEAYHTSSALAAGIRPRDLKLSKWSHDRLKQPTAIAIQLLMVHYFRALDAGCHEALNAYVRQMKKYLPHCPTLLQIPLHYELTYYHCMIERDDPQARHHFERVQSVLADDFDINGRRVLSAYALVVLGDDARARKYAQQGINAFDSFPLRGQAKMERSLIKDIIGQSQAASASVGGPPPDVSDQDDQPPYTP